jgi:apolipoprotein N-acyltransferase
LKTVNYFLYGNQQGLHKLVLLSSWPCFFTPFLPSIFLIDLSQEEAPLEETLLTLYRWGKKYYHNALPLLSALFSLLAFMPGNKGYLGWICLLPLFFYIEKEISSGKKCFRGGFLAGFIFFLHLNSYISLSVNFFFTRYFGILVVVATALYSALFWGLFSLTVSFILQDKKILLPALALPSAWVLGEYLRSQGFLGHTGGFLGYTQESIPLLQSISLYGYWGLSFLMVFAQALIFLLWRSHREKVGRRCCREIIISVFIFLALLGGGLYLPSLFPVEKNDRPLRLALVQGNIPQEDILNPSLSRQNFQKYLDLSRRAHTLYAPLDLIVWPETVFSANVARNHPEAEKEMAALSEETGAAILFGAMYEDQSEQKTFNSVLLQKDRENLGKRYDKIKLVPFAEYFPLPNLLNSFFNLNISLGTYTPGTAAQSFNFKDFFFGGIICFESYFPHPARSIVQKGADHLFVLTNDAWFLDSNGLEQHARAAAIRALETGVGVTQIANTGYTISFDPYGQEVLRLPVLQEGVALLETKMPRRQTLYLLGGNYFLYPCLLILFIACRKSFLREQSL